MTKLKAIWAIIRSEHFIVITQKSQHSVTPKWGDRDYWKEARIAFARMDDKCVELTKNG